MKLATLLLLAGLAAVSGTGHAHRLGHTEANSREHVLIAHGTAPERVRALIGRYHLNGEDHVLDEGWALLRPALESDSTDPATLLAAAWLAQAGHAFEEAQSYLRHVLLLRPDHGEAWLLRASIALVQGEVDQAREACRRITLAAPMVVTAACFARTDAHEAGPDGARRAYERLANTLALQAPAREDLLGWLHGVAGDLAARGGLNTRADVHYRQATALSPTVTIRAGYADLLLATGRPGRVEALITADDTAPALVLRRVLAMMMMGEAPERLIRNIESRFSRWIADGDLRHAREMALFYLHVARDPALAYDLARRNFQLQREPEDRALLCQAAARVEQSSDARCSGHLGRLPMMTAVSSASGR